VAHAAAPLPSSPPPPSSPPAPSYLASCRESRLNFLSAAGASLFGVADWVTALEVASPGLKASDRIDVPVLYSHGVRDPRIDIAETETMVRTLRANGVEAVFIRIPDEGHGWRKLSNQLFCDRRQAEFLEEKLGVARAMN
jgi:pimeloyl-ACP methyl ester carboxylesterase